MSLWPSVVVVAPPRDFVDAPYDAFVERHCRLLTEVSSRVPLRLVTLRREGDKTKVSSRWREIHEAEISLPHRSSHRRARLARVAGLATRASLASWEAHLLAVVRQMRPAVVVTLGPWMDEEYRSLFDAMACVHLFEEDLTKMHELASQSRQARAFRAVEVAARRRGAGHPRRVIIISEAERPSARARYAGSAIVHVPHTLDHTSWRVSATPSQGTSVLVVGALNEERNFEGLAEVLDALELGQSDVRLSLLSGGGIASRVLTLVDRSPFLEILPPTTDVYGAYRTAFATLVPAKRATGVKTTILQGWATGCPVVTFDGSASTVNAPEALLTGGDASAVVSQLGRLATDEHLRRRLAAAGSEALCSRFDPTVSMQLFLQTLVAAAPSLHGALRH